MTSLVSMHSEPAEHLEEELVTLAVQIDAATHSFLTKLRAFDNTEAWARQGLRTCAQWVSWRIGIDLRTARSYLQVAHALAGLPAIDEALRRGAVSYSKVRAMVRVATTDNERLLLHFAEYATASQIEQIVVKYAGVLRAEQYGPNPIDDRDRRYVARRTNDDGMVVIRAVLHPEEAELVWTALDKVGQELLRSNADDGANNVAPEAASVAQVKDAAPVALSARVANAKQRVRFDRVDALVALAKQVVRGDSPHRSPSEICIAVPHELLAARAVSSPTSARRASEPSEGPHCGGQRGLQPERGALSSSPMLGSPRAALSCVGHRGDDALRGDEDSARDTTALPTPSLTTSPTTPLTSAATASAPEAGSNKLAINDNKKASWLQRVAQLDSGTPLSREAARRLCCDAGIVAMVVGDDGNPLSVGRKSRTIPGAIKRALVQRDRTCTFPGCTTRVYLEGHHVRHWAHGGDTSLDNLCLLCDYHHRHVHEYGFTVEMTSEGPAFRTPQGARIVAAPPRDLEAARGALPPIDTDARRTRDTCADGVRVDYGAAIDGLVRADGL